MSVPQAKKVKDSMSESNRRHYEHTVWYDTVSSVSRYNGDSQELANQPMLLQMQGVSLQAAHEDSRMVPSRQAIYSVDT